MHNHIDNVYRLPSHPSLISQDPLGLCDNENPTFWDVIVASVNKFKEIPRLSKLPDLVDNLVYSLHGDGQIDLGFLQNWVINFESSVGQSHADSILLSILTSAILLPTLFPSHELIYLGPDTTTMELSLAQIRSLLAHQILCTVVPPRGNNWGCTLRCWYSSSQPTEYAVRGYLETAFRFFEDIDEQQLSKTTIYQYFHLPLTTTDSSLSEWSDCSNPFFQTLELESITADTVPFPHPTIHCVLVSSHKEPGFGPSCTQEELVTAACPQLMPLGALFVQPPIPDNAVVIARGVSPASTWTGQGRDARLQHFIDIPDASYTILFLDALELDTFEAATSSSYPPDLIPENLIRELNKAYAGFSALSKLGVNHVVSPLWGSGAFGGNPVVKSVVLGMAAARAGICITLMIDEKRHVSHEPDSVKLLDALSHMKTSSEAIRVSDGLDGLCSIPVGCEDWFDLLSTSLVSAK